MAMPPLSISSRVFCTDQFFRRGSVRPMMSIAASQVGGTMWWWTSMRCGLACANTFGTKPETAPSANAAVPPASIPRRLTPVAVNGWMQQLQTADSRRVVASNMDDLPGPGSEVR